MTELAGSGGGRLVRWREQLRGVARRAWEERRAPGEVGRATAVGLFVGTLPLYGLHLPICAAVSKAMRLNLVIVYLAANVSNPVVAPWLVAGGLVVGEWLRFGIVRPLDPGAAAGFLATLSWFTLALPDRYLSCLLGDAVIGAALAAIGGPVSYLLARRQLARMNAGPGPCPPIRSGGDPAVLASAPGQDRK